MGQLPPSDLTVRFPTVEEAVNNLANVVYAAIPWSAARANWYLLAVKGTAFGVKTLTPSYQAFYSPSGVSATQADILNFGIVLLEGVDPEDVIKELNTRGVIHELKDYFFGSDGGSIMLTHSFYADP